MGQQSLEGDYYSVFSSSSLYSEAVVSFVKTIFYVIVWNLMKGLLLHKLELHIGTVTVAPQKAHGKFNF